MNLELVPMLAFASNIADRPITSVVSSMGWVIVVWGVRLLFTGRLITGREADERDKRYAEKVEECRDLRSTLGAMADGMETSNAMIRSIMQQVKEEEDNRVVTRPPTRRRTAREDTTQGGP